MNVPTGIFTVVNIDASTQLVDLNVNVIKDLFWAKMGDSATTLTSAIWEAKKKNAKTAEMRTGVKTPLVGSNAHVVSGKLLIHVCLCACFVS